MKSLRSSRISGQDSQPRCCATSIEVALIFVLFFLVAGGAVPDVNEAHYLTKAKHYWDPDWCSGDFFLESADAHLVFYWTLGWLASFLSLGATAWIGRCVTWLLLAWSWQRLSVAVVPQRLVSLLTAAMFATLLRCTHMAGEWVIGGVEAKGLAYAFVFLGLEAVVRNRWWAVWVLFGLASAFHVLVGGWSVVAGIAAWLCSPVDRPAARSMLPWLGLGGLLSLPGLVPGVLLATGVDADVVREANEVYTWRLAHHLSFSHILAQKLTLDFGYLGVPPTVLGATHLYFVRHSALLFGAMFLFWAIKPDEASKRLYMFVAGTVMIAVAGIVIDQATWNHPDLAAKLLRYYWFRLSDVMVPLGATFLLAQLLLKLQASHPKQGSLLLGVLIVFAGLNVADLFARRTHDPRPPSMSQAMRGADASPIDRYRQWRATCEWIRDYTPDDAVFLTPRHQQTFKWYTERPEVVCWKDMPQDAVSLVEWRDRIGRVFPRRVAWYGLAAHGRDEMLELSAQYGFQYVVVDKTQSQLRLPFLRVYPPRWQTQATYEVYRLPPAVAAISDRGEDDDE